MRVHMFVKSAVMCQPEAKGLCAAEHGTVFGVLSLQCNRENREHLKYLRNVTVLQEKSRANQDGEGKRWNEFAEWHVAWFTE